MPRARSRWLPWALFALSFAVYLLSPARQMSDSVYSTLLSESLLTRASFELDGLVEVPADLSEAATPASGIPFQLEVVDGRLYYRFPPGGPVLTVPLLAAMRPFGLTALGADGRYDAAGERRVQKRAAALLTALLAVAIFRTARLLLTIRASLLLTMAAAFGTQMWSTASRALWSHTWAVLLLGIAAYLLLAAETRSKRLNAYLLGSLLAWAFFCRPTSAIPILAVTVYVALFYRDRVLPLVGTLAGWLGLFVVYSWLHFGALLPSYYLPARLGGGHFPTALLGNLVSPSRGLLVFVPQLAFVAYLILRYRGSLPHRRLVLLSTAIVAGHWLVVSSYFHWWGGHSYGPRLMTDALPWLILAGICGTKAWLEARSASARDPVPAAGRLEGAVAALLLVSAVYLNGVGALSREANYCWNFYPVNVDVEPSRVWDWSDPQFLAWLRPRCAEHEGDAGGG